MLPTDVGPYAVGTFVCVIAALGLAAVDVGQVEVQTAGENRAELLHGGRLRRNTDRRTRHRHAALCLATAILIVGKLITYDR